MSSISFKHVGKTYPDNVEVIRDMNLEIKDKEFVVLVGPSGCGKSTMLRMIAGLEEVTNGNLYIGDQRVNDVEPKDRDIAMVFQNYALYPHMTVYDNMAFGLKLRKVDKKEIDRKVNEVAHILDLESLLKRKPKALSGGQRQRVALGRAMVRDPSVFLLDEPLSNLDAKLRTQMRTEISQLHQRLNTTFVYVTHDQTEAMTMGDRIVVLRKGTIQQVDTPQNLYDFPCNVFVAGFIGSPQMNFLSVKVDKHNDDYIVIMGDKEFHLPNLVFDRQILSSYIGKEVILGIRPEDLHVVFSTEQFPSEYVVNMNVKVTEPMGAEVYIYGSVEKNNLIVRMPGHIYIKSNDVIRIYFNINKIHLFDKDTEKVICNGVTDV